MGVLARGDAKRGSTNLETLSRMAERMYAAARPSHIKSVGAGQLSRPIEEILQSPTHVDWLLRNRLERRVIVVKAGQRGHYKSLEDLDCGIRVALAGGMWLALTAEGAGLDRRISAWLKVHAPNLQPSTLNVRAVERRLDLNSHEGRSALRSEIDTLGLRPDLISIDTF